jgi:hypothetical protein
VAYLAEIFAADPLRPQPVVAEKAGKRPKRDAVR